MLLPKMLFCCDPPEVLYRTEKQTKNDGLIRFNHSFSRKLFKVGTLKWVHVYIGHISQFRMNFRFKIY